MWLITDDVNCMFEGTVGYPCTNRLLMPYEQNHHAQVRYIFSSSIIGNQLVNSSQKVQRMVCVDFMNEIVVDYRV
jgi:hypothetical protein